MANQSIRPVVVAALGNGGFASDQVQQISSSIHSRYGTGSLTAMSMYTQEWLEKSKLCSISPWLMMTRQLAYWHQTRGCRHRDQKVED